MLEFNLLLSSISKIHTKHKFQEIRRIRSLISKIKGTFQRKS